MFYVVLCLAGAVSWGAILRRWQVGLVLLVLFLPFGGAITLWTGGNTLSILAKDILVVTPLYVAFALRGVRVTSVQLPVSVLLSVISFALIVILEMGNPKVANVAVALVGAKVSLFYIPLLVVTATMLKSEGDAVTLLRTMPARRRELERISHR